MRRLPLATAIAVLAALLATPGASALYDNLEDGTTRLELDSGLRRDLHEAGVRVMAVRPAKLRGRILTLPVASGQIDPAGASGTLAQKGGLRLSVGGRSVVLAAFGIHTGEQRLSAKLDGRTMRIARTDGFSFRRQGFGNAFELDRLRLRKKVADLLNRALGLDGLFRGGRSLGSIAAITRPQMTKINGGEIVFSGAEAFFAKLKSAGVEAVGFEVAADASPAPTYRYLVRHGDVSIDMRSGFVLTTSGLRIRPIEPSPGPTMLISGMGVDFETASFGGGPLIQDATGNPLGSGGPGGLSTLDLAAATRTVDPKARTMTLSTVPAAITATFAAQLNEHYAAPKGQPGLFVPGEALGTVTVSLQAH